ncbi:unnamed protein product [Periconia digitata]|uniref:Uncharacterized protein n=1 Tax=Periconia digitata TaxID=1303443 RepID=A0A9W4UR47_9PLEO|nr:unnamed protein product [Periconia digitata]
MRIRLCTNLYIDRICMHYAIPEKHAGCCRETAISGTYIYINMYTMERDIGWWSRSSRPGVCSRASLAVQLDPIHGEQEANGCSSTLLLTRCPYLDVIALETPPAMPIPASARVLCYPKQTPSLSSLLAILTDLTLSPSVHSLSSNPPLSLSLSFLVLQALLLLSITPIIRSTSIPSLRHLGQRHKGNASPPFLSTRLPAKSRLALHMHLRVSPCPVSALPFYTHFLHALHFLPTFRSCCPVDRGVSVESRARLVRAPLKLLLSLLLRME